MAGLPDAFAATDRAGALFAVRVVRAVLVFAAVLRVVAAAGLRAVAVAARFDGPVFVARAAVVDRAPRSVVADFVVRAGALRAAGLAFAFVLPARLAAARAVAARGAAVRVVATRAVVRPVAARFAVGAALARVVFFGAVFAAAVLVVRAAEARVVLAAVLPPVVEPFAVDAVFGAAFDLPPDVFDVDERSDAAAPARVVLAAVPRALVPAVRRPPARTAIARLRRPSVVSLLMIRILCSILKLVGREAAA